MSRLLSPLRVCFLVCLCVPLVSGCGGGGPPLVSVRGKVTLNDKPVTAGQVSLSVMTEAQGGDANPTALGMAVGKIDANGEYVITTNGKDGAPEGTYKVTVTPSMVPTGDTKKTLPFDARYMDPKKTPLTIVVVKGASPGAYDLRMK